MLAVVDDDEEQARREAASMIAFYGSVKSYGELFEATRLRRARPKAIQAAFAARDVDAMVGAVTEAMVDEFAVAGTPEQVARQAAPLRRRRRRGRAPSPSFRITPQRVAENLAALTAHCGPAG